MSNATILVVDDEELIRWSLREGLRNEGYEIFEAGTGAEAIEQFKRGVDLVLLEPLLDVPVQELGAVREPALALGRIGEQHVLEPAERALAVDRYD